MLQTVAPVDRVTVTWVVLSEMIVFPPASVIATVSCDVEPSAAIELGSNVAVVFAAPPIGLIVIVTLQPESVPELMEICAFPEAPATVVYVCEALPPVAWTTVVAAGVSFPDELLA